MSTTPLEHWLGAQLAGRVPRNHEVALSRRLEGDELLRITAADDLIIKQASSAGYVRCLEVLAVIENRADELRREARPSGSLIAGLRAAVGSLTESLGRLGDDVSATKSGELLAAVNAIREGATWPQVARVADPNSGSLHRHRSGLVVWRPADGSGLIDVVAACRAAVLEAQTLVARQFLALESDLRAAATLLRELALEVVEGRPAIFTIPASMLEQGEPGGMTPRPLALDRIDTVLANVRSSREYVATVEAGDSGSEPGDAEASTDATEDEPEKPHEPGGASATDDRSEASGAHEAASVDADRLHSPEPLLLGPLFRQARELQPALEHAWSEALNQAVLAPALAEQLAAVTSAIAGFGVKIGAQDRGLEAAGLDPRLPAWPPGIATLGDLDISPNADEAARSRDLRMAQLHAMQSVLEALGGLREPSTVQASFGQSEVERVDRFWDAGAFGVLRARMGLLERLTREHEEWLAGREAAPAVSDGERQLREALDRLFLGARALSNGDPEAALLHAVAALSARFGSSPGGIVSGIEDAVASNAHLPPGAEKVLRRAVAVVANLSEGRGNLAAAVLLARDTLALSHGLLVGPLPENQMSAAELARMFEADLPDTEPLEGRDPGDVR